MSILYRLVRNTARMKGGGKYFARVKSRGTVSLDDMAKAIQDSCSLKASDVNAVLIEFVEQLGESIRNGMTVSIKGLGTFKPTIQSVGTLSPDDFHEQRNIKSLGVSFTPQRTRHGAHGTYTIDILQGAEVINITDKL